MVVLRIYSLLKCSFTPCTHNIRSYKYTRIHLQMQVTTVKQKLCSLKCLIAFTCCVYVVHVYTHVLFEIISRKQEKIAKIGCMYCAKHIHFHKCVYASVGLRVGIISNVHLQCVYAYVRVFCKGSHSQNWCVKNENERERQRERERKREMKTAVRSTEIITCYGSKPIYIFDLF